MFRKAAATTTTLKKALSSVTDFLSNFLDANEDWDTTQFRDMTN
jgi:hypothetical protein